VVFETASDREKEAGSSSVPAGTLTIRIRFRASAFAIGGLASVAPKKSETIKTKLIRSCHAQLGRGHRSNAGIFKGFLNLTLFKSGLSKPVSIKNQPLSL
jgi:hypothetical protein